MRIIVQTPRFTIREYMPEEQAIFKKLFTDERLTPYLPQRNGEEVDQLFKDILNEYTESTGLSRWAVIDTDGDHIGFGMLRLETGTGEVELGYVINYNYWNKGIATELAEVLVNYGFNQKHLTEILAVTDHNNIPSQRVLEKAGFKRDGVIVRKDMELAFFVIKNV